MINDVLVLLVLPVCTLLLYICIEYLTSHRHKKAIKIFRIFLFDVLCSSTFIYGCWRVLTEIFPF
mgnify:CR=1 FL=1